MIWFVKFYVYVCSALIKPKNVSDEEEFQLKYIPSGMLSTSELSLMQAKKEIAVFGERTQRMFGRKERRQFPEDIQPYREVREHQRPYGDRDSQLSDIR